MGVKLTHISTGAPVFLLQIETVPQAFMWVDTPATSNQGLPHALEHLLVGKGAKGRYSSLLRDMRLSVSDAATTDDFNFYEFSSGAGLAGFFEQLHAWLDALYRPDFTDAEAEREFYHFAVVTDSATKKKMLIEKGTVYNEMLPRQRAYDYYFALNGEVWGSGNPFTFYSGGVPEEMRGVTPADIRSFHERHYRLGPTTGFIFVFDPRENLPAILNRLAQEFRTYAPSPNPARPADISTRKPKYDIQPSEDARPAIYPFPAANATSAAEVLMAWRPVENASPGDLKLLQLFLDGLSDGQQSLLYKALIDSSTRELNSGATAVYSDTFLGNSPYFPVSRVGISGIPGTAMSVALLEQLRSVLLEKIKEVSEYPDASNGLIAFNKVVADEALAEHRSQIVWTKSPPAFGSSTLQTRWKDHLLKLEMDTGFKKSLSEETVWQDVTDRLRTNKNIWHDVIQKFHLLDVPYAAASAPSRQLLDDLETAKRDRIKQITTMLMQRYHTDDDQEALSRFEQDETAKTKQIDEIEAKVARPAFTDHPPLTPDDNIRYKQFRLASVPVVASVFERPPTIDVGLSFDLGKIPARYYKLLPLIPRCLDSLGLKQDGKTVPYSDLLGQIEKTTYRFTIAYPYDLRSNSATLEIRASASDPESFRETLDLIARMMEHNDLQIANADRLRDVIARKISNDDLYLKQAEGSWITNPAFAFRRRNSPLFLAVSSYFTDAHWDGRLQWLLHKPVDSPDIDALEQFAEKTLAGAEGLSKVELSQQLDKIGAVGLQAELVEYWRRNLSSFSDSELTKGFRQLTLEVQQDLRTGPANTIEDLKKLQEMILRRQALQIDLTLSQSDLDRLRPDLVRFLESIPDGPDRDEAAGGNVRLHFTNGNPPKLNDTPPGQGPFYFGLVNPDQNNGNAVFLADLPGYSRLDRKALVQVLASNLLSGSVPSGFFMKTWEAGLAYSNGIRSEPEYEMLEYYADRSPDLSALVDFVISIANGIPQLQERGSLDYALSQTFSFSRAVLTPSIRGQLMARDLRDGQKPETVRRFSAAILALRKTPGLVQELRQAGFDSICGVLLTEKCMAQQQGERSVFFFFGSEKVLSEAEKRLSIPRLVRLYPSDFWME